MQAELQKIHTSKSQRRQTCKTLKKTQAANQDKKYKKDKQKERTGNDWQIQKKR